jgi:hypothetical protein
MYSLMRTELGYLYRGIDLDSGSNLNPNLSSIRSLARRRTTSAAEFDDLLRGNNSFGRILQNHLVWVVPSPQTRGPRLHGTLRPHIAGGYLIKRHGSRNGGTIDAIQIEVERERRKHLDQLCRYSFALANSLHRFVCLHYRSPTSNMTSLSPDVINSLCNTVTQEWFLARLDKWGYPWCI